MKTSTIYRAMSGAYRTILFTQTVDDFLHRKARQWAKFERELLRRMDERDALVAERERAARFAVEATDNIQQILDSLSPAMRDDTFVAPDYISKYLRGEI